MITVADVLLCAYRVFNWDGRKGGAGMEDLPSLISSAIEATLNNTEAMRIYAAEKADKLGSNIHLCHTYFSP